MKAAMASTSSTTNAVDWRIKRKEDAKRHTENLLKEWMKRITIDDIVLSGDMKSIVTIDSKPVNEYNMVYLRSLCIILKINGYKNKRRDEMIGLLLERKRIQYVESIHYPGDEESANLPLSHSDDSDDSVDDSNDCAILLRSVTDNRSGSTESLPSSPADARHQRGRGSIIDMSTTTTYSSPETRSMSRARRLLSPTEGDALNGDGASSPAAASHQKRASAKKKPAKGSIPVCVKQEGTYYRAINVWFDERNRTDIMNMGASPTMQELDARQFVNKRTYDKLLQSFLDTTVDNDAINFVGFGTDEYLLSCGITENHSSTFDVLTSKELKQVLDYIVHWYNVSLRNNKTSGNHADFHQFVGCRPFVYYYHLWLMEIPHLSFLAVPVLDLTVRRVSTERDDDDESRSNTTTRSKAGSNRKRGKSSDDSMLSAASAANAVSKQQQEKKLKVIESHLKAMEDIEREKLSHRTKRDKQANHLSLTAELKTIEEMISMKRTELQHYNTLDPEREVLDRQLKKLRRRRDRLMQLVCDSDDDSDDGDANNEAV
jgi:hypothetical protein